MRRYFDDTIEARIPELRKIGIAAARNGQHGSDRIIIFIQIHQKIIK